MVIQGDLAAGAAFLEQTPAQQRSTAAVKFVAELAKDPAALKRLAMTDSALQPVLRSIAVPPLDSGVAGAISTLMQVRMPPAELPKQQWAAVGAENGGRQVPKDGMRRTYGAGVELPVNMAQPISKEGYVDPMDTSGRTSKAQTRGWGTDRTVGILCSFEVGLVNPKTGKHETVVFKGVEDHRKAGWGFGSYDTSRDFNSEVLVCTGQEYEKGRPSVRDPGTMISGSQVAISAFDYRSIPDLKQRVETFLKTGDTGNSKVKK